MAHHLNVPTIWHHTGCAASSIYMLLADYWQLGTAAHAHRVHEQRGRRHILVSEKLPWNGVNSNVASFMSAMAISTHLSRLFLLMRAPMTVCNLWKSMGNIRSEGSEKILLCSGLEV